MRADPAGVMSRVLESVDLRWKKKKGYSCRVQLPGDWINLGRQDFVFGSSCAPCSSDITARSQRLRRQWGEAGGPVPTLVSAAGSGSRDSPPAPPGP
eukprot:6377326-Prymnesium_polylepis.1